MLDRWTAIGQSCPRALLAQLDLGHLWVQWQKIELGGVLTYMDKKRPSLTRLPQIAGWRFSFLVDCFFTEKSIANFYNKGIVFATYTGINSFLAAHA